MTINTAQAETQEISQVAPKDISTETNLRKMARALEEEKAARIRLEQQLQEHSERFKAPAKSEDDDYRGDEPYIDRRSLKKELNQFAQDFKKEASKEAQEYANKMIEQERQQNFLRSNPDFIQVMNDDSLLQKFVDKYPDMAEPILEMPDNFARKKLVYQNIKALGINRPEVPKVSIQDKIDSNRRSVFYQPTGGNTPPYASQGDFSDAGMKNAYAKQQALIKGRRG